MLIALIGEMLKRLSRLSISYRRSERARRKALRIVEKLPAAIQQDIGWPRFADQRITDSHSMDNKHSFD